MSGDFTLIVAFPSVVGELEAVLEVFKQRGIECEFATSVFTGIYVKKSDALKARDVLRTSSELAHIHFNYA